MAGFESVISSGFDRTDNLLVSAAEKNAQELLLKCRKWVEVFQRHGFDLKLERESTSELAFKNGGKILSLAQNPSTVRGFTGNVYLDEFAHHAEDRAIYEAIFPAITLGYRLTVLSTPLGQSGLYHAIWTDDRKYSGFTRHRVTIDDAIRDGLGVDREFIRANIDDDGFRQEYLCEFVDEATAFFSYELIRRAIGTRSGEPGESYIGMDIGRVRDITAIYVLGKLGNRLQTLHLEILKGQAFAAQGLAFRNLWRRFDCHRGCIDATGIGMQLAEDLRREFPRLEPVTFTAPVKDEMVTSLKKQMELGNLQIPDDQALISDIHSIRKTVTSSNNVRFDADRDEHGHADRFWALALANHAATSRRASWTVY